METNKEQDVQITQQATPDSENVQVTDEEKPTQYSDLSKDELIKTLMNRDSRIHDVNEESKNRKIKLRQIEQEREAEQTRLLEEQNKFKELYEAQKEKTNDYDNLVAFRESVLAEKETELADLEKKLSSTDRAELDILSDLPLEKKLKWIKSRLGNRQTVDLDLTSSTRKAGSIDKLPTNRRELTAMSVEDRKTLKEKHPTAYKEAMNKA